MRWLNWKVFATMAIALSASWCAGGAATPSATTQPPTTAEEETRAYELRVLLASLSAVDPDARIEARRQLIKLGKPAIKPLEELIRSNPDPVARDLARQVLDAFREDQDEKARAAAPADELWEATTVSLHFDKEPASKVFESACRQAGFEQRFPRRGWDPIDPHAWRAADDRRITVHLERVKFWEAILELERQSALRVTEGWLPGNVVFERPRDLFSRVRGQPEERPPTIVHGPFLIVADGRASSGHFRTLTVYTEPKLRVMPASVEVRVDEALDDAGRTVEPFPTGPELPLERGQRRLPHDVTNVLLAHVPPRAPLAYVKGVIQAKLVSPRETGEIVEGLKDGELHFSDGRGLTIDVTKAGADQYSLVIQLRGVEFPQRLTLASAVLEDADGMPLESASNVTYAIGPRDAGRTAAFRQRAPGAAPAKVKLQIPRKPRAVDIPFEFGQRPAVAAPAAAAARDEHHRITLNFKNAPPAEVYASLFRQAEARVRLYPDDLFERMKTPPVTIDLEKATFWEAVDELERQTNLAIEDYGRQCILAAVDPTRAAEARNAAVSRIGPYKVVAKGFGPRSRVYRLEVFVEPRLRVLARAPQAEIERAIEVPNLPPFMGPPRHRRAVPSELLEDGLYPREAHVFKVDLPEELTPNPLKYLKGYVRAKVVRRMRTIEFDGIDNADNADRVIDGQRVLVNLTNPKPGQYTVALTLFDRNPATPGLLDALPWLVNAKGNALGSNGHGRGGDAGRVELTWHFRPGEQFGHPTKLLLDLPTEVAEERIPFAFGDPPAPLAP